MPLTISSAVCKDTKASLLAHLRDETLNFAGENKEKKRDRKRERENVSFPHFVT